MPEHKPAPVSFAIDEIAIKRGEVPMPDVMALARELIGRFPAERQAA